MKKDHTGYEGIHTEEAEDGPLKWTVHHVQGWSGSGHGALIRINDEPVGALSLPNEEAYEWLKTRLEHPEPGTNRRRVV